jgi:hypothetical protein
MKEMGKENVAHVYNGIQFSYKEEWNHAVYWKTDVTGDYYVEWDKSRSERQILHVFCLCNLDLIIVINHNNTWF